MSKKGSKLILSTITSIIPFCITLPLKKENCIIDISGKYSLCFINSVSSAIIFVVLLISSQILSNSSELSIYNTILLL